HEFAHKIDMLDNLADGVPPIANKTQLQRWNDVSGAAFNRIRTGQDSGLLSTYAASNPGEFFAVATEVFFTTPVALLEDEPDVYGVLRDFYRQDPAARATE
ncbi:MAG: zinc-dependent peptidase, partial [Acidimicrobiales bacterium]